jgi:hypothetical protein
MKLYEGNTRHGWATTDKAARHIDQLYDIRLKFIDKNAALAFHRKFLNINAENGPEITDHQLTSAGADEFRVFGTPEQSIAMLGNEGLKMFSFLMVVDRYFVKLFVICNDTYQPSKFQPMITDIIRRIKK